MVEILFNEKVGDYTLKLEVEGVKSVRNVPIKFKISDSTARFRREILRKKILDLK